MNCDDEINVAVFMKLENVRFALCKRFGHLFETIKREYRFILFEIKQI